MTETENQIFYAVVVAVIVGIAAILWRNYQIWRAWNDDYKREGEKLRLQRTPLP